jgi:Sec-independent protein translocase protein TatA
MDLFSSIGMQEILMILLVALLVIGPNKVAEFGKTLGNMSRNLKKASTDFTTSITREIEEEDKKLKQDLNPPPKEEKKS